MEYYVPPEPPQRVPSGLRIASLAFAVITGGVYASLSDTRYKQVPLAGALFAAGALVLIVSAGIAASGNKFGAAFERSAWMINALICAGLVVVFFVARTVGLPGWHRTDWPAVQLIAVATAIGYVGCFIAAARAWRRRRG